MALSQTQMNVELQELERWHRKLTVTVPAAEVKRERANALRTLGGRLNLKGFRKGKVPAHLVERRYGPAVEQEVLERVIREAYRSAVESEGLHPISEGELEGVEHEPGTDLKFTIGFDVQPSIELSRLGGFAAERPTLEITDEQVNDVVEQLRQQNSAWKPIEEGRPEDGDLVSVQIQRIDGEEVGEPQSYELILGQGDAIPDVEDAIRTLAVGQTDDFDVTFPDDFPNEERRGQTDRLRATLDGRRAQELPEANDEFAQSIGEFEDMADLRTKIREDLEREAGQRADSQVRTQLLDLVVEANTFEVPRSMTNRYIDALLGGPDNPNVTPEQRLEAYDALSAEADKAVKRILVIDRVAEMESLSASEDEIDERVESIAEKSGTTPAQVYAELQKAGRIEGLEREITESKVFDYLMGQSEITEAN